MDIREYEKISGYPHNGYPTDMSMSTGRIFIQRVGYGRATTRILPAPLTSLDMLYQLIYRIDIAYNLFHLNTIKVDIKSDIIV